MQNKALPLLAFVLLAFFVMATAVHFSEADYRVVYYERCGSDLEPCVMEYRHRMLWAGSSIVLWVVSVFTLLHAAAIALKRISGVLVWATCAFLLVSTSLAIWFGFCSPYDLTSQQIQMAVGETASEQYLRVSWLVDLSLVMAFVTILMLLVAITACSFRIEAPSQEKLRRDVFAVRGLFYSTSVFLSVGVAQIAFLYYWLALAAGGASWYVTWAFSFGIGGSMLFLTIFAILFFPASAALFAQVKEMEARQHLESADARAEWRRNAGLATSLWEDFRDLVVFLSPLIAGVSAAWV